jgi:hypothetical protein
MPTISTLGRCAGAALFTLQFACSDATTGGDPGTTDDGRASEGALARADRRRPDAGHEDSGRDAGRADAATDAGASSDAQSDPGSRGDGGGGCSSPKPGPGNTGVPAGTVLTPSGSIRVTTNGAVVEGLDIKGAITVLANDVTIRKVRIASGDYYPIRYFDNDNTGLVVEDSEIAATSGNVTSAIAFRNYTARRLNVHGSADGFKADENVLIEDCYIHDLSNGAGEHNDGVQSTGGKGVTIRHNTIGGASNACVQAGDENGATQNMTIDCNWLDGGGYTLNIRGKGATLPKNTRVTNNRFGRNAQYGPWAIDDPNPVVTGNVYDDNGAPIPF